MTHEADLLNKIYDHKQEVQALRKRIRRLGEGADETLFLEAKANHLKDKIDGYRAQLWKGVQRKKVYSPMFSSGLCRTGRVRPKSSH